MKADYRPFLGRRMSAFSGGQIAVLFFALLLLISIPILTHPLPPLSDYVNHLARMHVIATIDRNPLIARFYQIDWQIIPNLTMDLLVPILGRFMNIYLAGEVFIILTFALIMSGTLALNRALMGRWSIVPFAALPLLYNYVFLVGLMNYIFGIGVALWALAIWISLRDRHPVWRLAASSGFVVVLFFCHLSALGIYGVGLLAYEALRLVQATEKPLKWRLAEFVGAGLPFLAAVPLVLASPTMQLVSATYWEQRGKIDGLIYVIEIYSDIVAFALTGLVVAGLAWAARHRILHVHPFALSLLIVSAAVYLAMPRVMFATYMADQRIPIAVAFMFAACVDVELRHRIVRRGFLVLLLIIIAVRLIEVGVNWSSLADSTSEFRSSVRRIRPGSMVFVAYADGTQGSDVKDLGLVHAACLAMIERSSLVTTAFTVQGKQILHPRPEYRDFVDPEDATPPSISYLMLATRQPAPALPAFWLNWPKFDYLYVLFTEEDAPNPDPSRLTLVQEGDRFQLYRINKLAPPNP